MTGKKWAVVKVALSCCQGRDARGQERGVRAGDAFYRENTLNKGCS